MARNDEAYARGQETAFAGEHVLAYLTAIGAIVLAALGLLEGFGVVNILDAGAGAAATSPDVNEGGNATTSFLDGVLYLLPAATLALLSLYFHSSDHHRLRDVRTLDNKDKTAWGVEHGGAMAAGLAATVMTTIGFVVGFDIVSNNYRAEDGILWQLAALVPAVLSVTLHQVRHHQTVAERDVIIAMIEERIVAVPTTRGATGATSPADERMS